MQIGIRNNKFQVISLLFVAALASLPSNVFAVDITVLGAGSYGGGLSTPATGVTFTNTSASVGFGMGVLATTPIAPLFDLVGGVIYVTAGSSYNINITGVPTAIPATNWMSFIRIPITVTYQFYNFLSVGLGGYYARGTGNMSGISATVPYSSGWEANGFVRDDYGLIANVNFDYPLMPGLGFYSSVQFARGFANLANPLNSLTTNGNLTTSYNQTDLSLFLGLKFSL